MKSLSRVRAEVADLPRACRRGASCFSIDGKMLLKWRQQQTPSCESSVLGIANVRVWGQWSLWSNGQGVYCIGVSKTSMYWIFILASDRGFFFFSWKDKLVNSTRETTSTENSIIIHSWHLSCRSKNHCCPSTVWVSQITCEPSWRHSCPRSAVPAQWN